MTTTIGGFFAGVGGAFLSLSYPGSWNQGLSSGQGLMAVALVIFARWNPLRCVGAALLFGAAGALGPSLQSIGVTQGYYFFNAAPYILTLAIMIATSSAKHSAARHARRAQHGEVSMATIEADPYPWPYNGDLRPENTAIVVIDMQTDFCGEGGYVDKMGYDLSLTRAPIEPIKRLLSAARAQGLSRHPYARGPSAGPLRPARQQALALAPHRRRHRRSRPLRQDPRARRAGLGDHSRARAGARRDRHRQAGQGLVLRDRPRTDAAHAAASRTSC